MRRVIGITSFYCTLTSIKEVMHRVLNPTLFLVFLPSWDEKGFEFKLDTHRDALESRTSLEPEGGVGGGKTGGER